MIRGDAQSGIHAAIFAICLAEHLGRALDDGQNQIVS